MEWGETVRDAAHREFLEETCLDVEILEVAEVFERIERDPGGGTRFHFVIVDFMARLRRQADRDCARAATDITEVRWVALDAVSSLEVTPGLLEVLQRARQRFNF